MAEQSTTVAPLNLDNLLGKCRNRVALVGIELEGGWNKVPPKCRIERDSSVFKNPSTATVNKLTSLGVSAIGELVSQPMSPAGVGAWLRKHYPTYHDNTCGLHIHMSFENNWYYSQLMIPEFQVTMLYYLKQWAYDNHLPTENPIWDRIAGKNEFCNHSFWPDEQLKSRKDYDHFRHGNRYSAVAYRKKNLPNSTVYTIECRVLPMMETPDLASSALKQVIRITNACLVKVKNRKIPFKVDVMDEMGKIVEMDRGDL